MNEDVKVLIVDDEPRNLDALEVMLASSGCTLVRAQSGDDALLAMLRHEFAAMIFDIRMPQMGGIELANLVKQRGAPRTCPLFFSRPIRWRTKMSSAPTASAPSTT